MLNEIFTMDSSTIDEVYTHLIDCDNTFIPPLSQRVDLITYAEKLVTRASNFEMWNMQKHLIGLISSYMNNGGLKTVFITNVSVCPQYIGRGIAKKLLNECINEVKLRGYSKIQLEVNKQSIPAINLYYKFGFRVIETEGKILTMNLNLMEHDCE